MSNEHTQQSDSGDSILDGQMQLTDPEDYHRTQRLKEIHSARREVHDAIQANKAQASRTEHRNQERAVANAVSVYAMEILPLLQKVEFDTSLPSKLPWEEIEDYAYNFGYHDLDGYPISAHTIVFQNLNEALAEIRPLITEDDNNEWEI